MADHQRKWHPDGPGRPPKNGKCRAKRATKKNHSLASSASASQQAPEAEAGPSEDSIPLSTNEPAGLDHTSTGVVSMAGQTSGDGALHIPALGSLTVGDYGNISAEMPGQPPADQGLNPTQPREFQPAEMFTRIPLIQCWDTAGREALAPMQAPHTGDPGSYVGVLNGGGRFGGCSATVAGDPGTVTSTVQEELVAQRGLHHQVSPLELGQRPFITLMVHLKPGQRWFPVNCFVVPSHPGADLVLCLKDAHTVGLSNQGPEHWPAGTESTGAASQYSNVGSWGNGESTANPSLPTLSCVTTGMQPWSASGADAAQARTTSPSAPSPSPWITAPSSGFIVDGNMISGPMANDNTNNATFPPSLHEGGRGPHRL